MQVLFMQGLVESIQNVSASLVAAGAVAVGVLSLAVLVVQGMRKLTGAAKKLAVRSLTGAVLIGGMVVVGTDDAGSKPGTNDVSHVEGARLGRRSLEQARTAIADDDVAAGWRVVSVRSNALAAATFAMPLHATVWASAQASGRGWGAWHIPLEDWRFTYGDVGWTNGFVWVEGYFRSKFDSRANEIRLLGERLALCPAVNWSRYNLAASRAWCATNDVDGLVVTFENAAVGDDPTKIASVQMELFPRTGEIALRYDLAHVGESTYAAGLVVDGTNHLVEVGADTREVVFRRVHPDDWDMDGLPNSIDDNPHEPSPDAGYNQTDAWAMAAFPSNATEIATMGYAAWAAARADEPNRMLVGLQVSSPKGAWPLCLSVGDSQVMCDGKSELKFVLDDGAKCPFSVSGGEVAAVSVPGMDGFETVGVSDSGFFPFETSVGGVTVHWDSPTSGWLGCLADVGITLDGRDVVDFGSFDGAGGIFGHFTPGTTHVLTGEVHSCHSNAFLDCTWSGGPGFVFARPNSLSTEVVWIAADDTAWSTNGIMLVTRYLGGYALTNIVKTSVGPEHVPSTGFSLSCQDVLFLNDDLRSERVYAVSGGLTATNGVTGQVTLSCDGAESTLSYFQDVFLTNRIPSLTFPLGVSSNDWFTTGKTVFMSCSALGEGELSATISFTNGTSCATSCVFNVIEPLRKLVNTDRYSPGHYYNPSRLVYGECAYLRVGVNGRFAPGDVEWRVVKGLGRIVSHVGFLATVEATADEGVVVVEARFNGDEIQPTFELPIVKPRVIPVRAFVVQAPGRLDRRIWSDTKIHSLIDAANEIYTQIGVCFSLQSVERNVLSNKYWNIVIEDIGFDEEGRSTVLLNSNARDLLDHYSAHDCIELYFVGTIGDGITFGEYCDELGIVIGKEANMLTVAHELGHQLGFDDCYPVNQGKIGCDYVTTNLHCYNEAVKKSTFMGKGDWGQEAGRGFYGASDSHGVVLEKLLMYGYNEGTALDIPDGSVYSLRIGTTNSFDTTYMELGG